MNLAVALLLLSAATPAPAHQPETGFLDRTVIVGKDRFRYQVYVPRAWTAARAWPVILFLHGRGESGDDGLLQTEVGLPSAIRRFPERFPAVVVMPQCRKDSFWTSPEMEAQALRALDDAIKEWNGDSKRIYLTGLSMGGYGSWKIAARLAARFAAVVPVCGGITPRANLPEARAAHYAGHGTPDPFATVARGIGKTPVWIFHGADDKVVPPEDSRKMARALEAAGGTVRYTELPGVGHDSWTPAYRDPELARWLLSQARRD